MSYIWSSLPRCPPLVHSIRFSFPSLHLSGRSTIQWHQSTHTVKASRSLTGVPSPSYSRLDLSRGRRPTTNTQDVSTSHERDVHPFETFLYGDSHTNETFLYGESLTIETFPYGESHTTEWRRSFWGVGVHSQWSWHDQIRQSRCFRAPIGSVDAARMIGRGGPPPMVVAAI